MDFGEILAIILIAIIVGLATFYIIRKKKKGKKCIGCPYACECSKKAKENCSTNDKKA